MAKKRAVPLNSKKNFQRVIILWFRIPRTKKLVKYYNVMRFLKMDDETPSHLSKVCHISYVKFKNAITRKVTKT